MTSPLAPLLFLGEGNKHNFSVDLTPDHPRLRSPWQARAKGALTGSHGHIKNTRQAETRRGGKFYLDLTPTSPPTPSPISRRGEIAKHYP